MPEPKTDRSAPFAELLAETIAIAQCEGLWAGSKGKKGWELREYGERRKANEARIARHELHARNVDKQRRRLLAEKFEAASDLLYEHAGWLKRQIATQSNQEDALTYEAKFKAAAVRASKLRTIAARLRGTNAE